MKKLINIGLNFPSQLKKLRMSKGLSKRDLGILIQKQTLQIHRYEDEFDNNQLPNLDVFKNICLLLQADPLEMLGLKWVEDNDVIINYRIKKNHFSINWDCPKCNGENIFYGNFNDNKGELDVGKLKNEYVCEHCGAHFDKLKLE